VRLPAGVADVDVADYVLHPVLLDACLHVSLAALPTAATEAYVPVGIERLRLYRRPGQTLWSHVRLRAANDAQRPTMTANVQLFDEAGAVVAEVEGLTLKSVSRAALLPNPGMSWQESVYEVMWHSTAHTPREDTPPAHWLVLNDHADTGRQLAARLQAEGAQCTLVLPGQTYEQLAEAAFRIDPANPDDYQRLLQAVPNVRGVISLWSLDAGLDDFEAALRQVCGSTLNLVHALASQGNPPSLWLVTRGAVACPNDQGAGAGSQMAGIAQSPLWGLGNVIALEHPELHCVRIDLDPNVVEVEALCTAIISKTHEDQLAFRDQVRLAPRLVPSRLQGAPATLHFREDAAYLIVGGTRGLGLLVARWMVSKGATYVVLVGRSGNADAAEIAALEHMGARVLVTQADVSEAGEVARVLAHIDRPLRGVIHAAGVLDDGILQQQTVERFAPVMAPKVQGAWHLHTLTQDMPLDFFVLFSSVASLLGSSGQANYAAANAFLDALAHYRRTRGLPAVTINWGGWSEVGAAARDEIRARMRMTGLVPISPEQGLAALEYLLSQSSRDGGLTQAGVVPINWPVFLQHFPAGDVPPFLSQVARQVRSRMPSEPLWTPPFRHALEEAPANERREQLATHVRGQVAQVLGLPEGTLPPPEQGFFNLGMDSLLTLELRNRLQTSLACTLPTTLTFNYPTIEALVAYLAEAVLALEPAVTSEAKRPRENAELGAMLAEVDQMTDDAVQQLLRRRS
jgi:acyl carrier protein